MTAEEAINMPDNNHVTVSWAKVMNQFVARRVFPSSLQIAWHICSLTISVNSLVANVGVSTFRHILYLETSLCHFISCGGRHDVIIARSSHFSMFLDWVCIYRILDPQKKSTNKEEYVMRSSKSWRCKWIGQAVPSRAIWSLRATEFTPGSLKQCWIRCGDKYCLN